MTGASLTVPLLTGTFAFTGVVLAQLVAVWLQRRRALYEDTRRWHTERRTLYAEFMTIVEDVDRRTSLAIEENDTSMLPNIHDPEDCPIPSVEREIQLIAPHTVVEAARYLDAVVSVRLLRAWQVAIDGYPLAEVDVDDEDDRHKRDLRVARSDFIEVARQDLTNPNKTRPGRQRIYASRAEIAKST